MKFEKGVSSLSKNPSVEDLKPNMPSKKIGNPSKVVVESKEKDHMDLSGI